MLITKRNLKQQQRKGKPRSRQNVTVRFGRQPFPPQLFNTVKYTAQMQYSVTSGIGKYIFSCNGLYDPDVTGGGHQPLYFDQLMAIYDHYTVLRSRCTITVCPPGTLTGPVLVSLCIDDDSSTPTDAIQNAERTPASFFFGIPSVTRFPPLKLSWSAANTFGGDPQSQDSLQGNVSSNPTEVSNFVMQHYDPALPSHTSNLLVQLEYDTVWDEYVTVAAS